jgi:hypothetical protein
MGNAFGMEIFNCFEDLEDDEFSIELIETVAMKFKYEIVKITSA